MPKKRPLTPESVAHLTRLATDARSALLLFRSVMSGHLKLSHDIRVGTNRVLKDFERLIRKVRSVKKS